MAFQVGQRVACIKCVGWKDIFGFAKSGPRYGDVLTVQRIATCMGVPCLYFSEWRAPYHRKFFRPLTEDPKAVKRTMERHFNKFLKEPVTPGERLIEAAKQVAEIARGAMRGCV